MNMKNHLKFTNPDFEKLFLKHYARRVIPGMRLGYWITVLLFAAFGVLDYFLMPGSYFKMWFIRYAVVIPALTVPYLMTYRKSLNRYMQFSISAGSIIVGMGIVAMLAVAQESDPGFKFYYAGLMLVIMGLCTLFRLRFYYALFSSLCIIAGYELTAIFIQKIYFGGASYTNSLVFINNNFFFIASNVIGLTVAYMVEVSHRIEFLQQEEIKSKNDDIIHHANRMRRELELARQIQSQLLPNTYPEIPGVKFASLFRPMEELGGDYFDFIEFEDRRVIGLFISDVSGHGLPAALISSMLKSLLSASGKAKFSVSGFLQYLNTHTSGIIAANFITAIYALYDSDSKILRLARAAHPYPLIMRNGEVIRVKSKGGVIGYNPYATYDEVEVRLEPGDKVLFYTDGLIEEIDDSKQPFESIFIEKVLPALSLMPIADVVSLSFRRLVDFKGNDSFKDDICILGMEIL